MLQCSPKPRTWPATALLAGVLLAGLLLSALPARAQTPLVPNADFTEGEKSPAGWELSGGKGRWVDRQVLEVTGTGQGSNEWLTRQCTFQPGALYRFQMRARRLDGAGCVISGPSFANRDHGDVSAEWAWYGHVFRAPENCEGQTVRIGQWESPGTVQFDAVRLTPVLPVYREVAGLLLGEGESIRGGRYVFQGTFGHEGSNFHRTLSSATAGFNSDRWCFGGDAQVTYKFQVPDRKFTGGRAAFDVNYRTRGACIAEVSVDGRGWRTVSTREQLGTAEAALPADMLPAEAVWLRLRAAPASNFQVDRVHFEGDLDGATSDAVGATAFATLVGPSPDLAFRQITLGEGTGWGDGQRRGGERLTVTVGNTGKGSARLRLSHEGDVSAAQSTSGSGPMAEGWIAPGEAASSDFGLPGESPGPHLVTIEVAAQKESGEVSTVKAELDYSLADFYRADYGELLGSSNWPVAVWWCDAAHKVPRDRSAPKDYAPGARLWAARNDFEAVQIVVRPGEKKLTGLTAKAGSLAGPDGATISAENVKILRVYYHFVDHPTDSTGVRDWWPDALPPLAKPLDVAAGENQPLWVLVHVPKDAKAGDYTGRVELAAEGWSATAPVRLHVWNFALPDRNHLETAFGLSPGTIFRYHQLKSEAEKRQVLDLYLESFAEHRISPYDPTPLDPIGVKFLPKADPPRAELDFSAFDPAMARAVERFHFNAFDLPIHGMGGGTFHERYEPSIEGFGESTPEYKAMFSSYLKQLEGHLREKGWLNMAYTYWFDEPDPKDYEFVRKGMERIKQYGPGIRRMLTEEPGDALAGAVDIWCPVSFNYDHTAAEKRRAAGDRFWWYVCCGPKAPYATLFIDHPATELRVWLWQTWQRKIDGVLVWSTNYWTSSAAYPDAPQNPYQDPMGYVSGYSTPRGVKRYWGNGDGRFLYPPLAAATPGASGPEPVLQAPVSSIRWEMLREGVEDYEYLWMLRDLVEKRRGSLPAERVKKYEDLLTVPEAITRDMTHFTADPGPIYARRAEVAEAIEALQ